MRNHEKSVFTDFSIWCCSFCHVRDACNDRVILGGLYLTIHEWISPHTHITGHDHESH